MNLRDLQYLSALAEHRHFARAAEACFVSQPTLSTQLKKLEDELGVVLVERGGRQVLLTEAGEAVLARARAVLEGAEDIRRIAHNFSNPEARTLRLGIFPTLGPYLMPHVLPGLRQRFPKLKILLVEEKTAVLLERLHAGKLDAAIVAQPVALDGLEAAPLFEEPFVLAVPAAHSLASRKSVASPELAGRELLLLEEGHCLRDQALDVCHLTGARERDGFRASSLETLRYMVAGGAGITLLPVLATRPPVAPTEGLNLIPFRGEPPHRTLALLWRSGSPLGSLLREVAARLGTLGKEAIK
ncbi:MAG TPA: LysR substrate-binding domain-containing protein [Gammaproteobacteria bacterium]|nr:LysR substrate-binding domain-containing protein [Gammaproteobacteria bacterium]